ncbi:MAG: carbohydrate kinase family protein [Minisyncoccia bacterium]
MDNNSEKIQFLAIGDIVTEPFIKLQDAQVTCQLDNENCVLSMRYGDKIPYESVTLCRAVGNSANAAVAAARLGVKSALMSYIGDDEIGCGNIEELKKNNVIIDHMVTVPGHDSNYHFVLWYDVDRTILIKHTEFPYEFPMNMDEPEWIYFSSIASNALQYHLQLTEYLKQHPNVKLAFQPGTFQIKLGTKVLSELYQHTEILFCNKEEAQRILETPDEHDMTVLIKNMHSIGPKKVVITDGSKGLDASDGVNTYTLSEYPDIAPPVERTGAGDATSSTIVAMMSTGMSFKDALRYGPINSMSVVQHIGAQAGLLSKEKIEEYIKNAPEDYQVVKL